MHSTEASLQKTSAFVLVPIQLAATRVWAITEPLQMFDRCGEMTNKKQLIAECPITFEPLQFLLFYLMWDEDILL